MGLFTRPDANLRHELTAARPAVGVPSPLGEDAKLARITDHLYKAATRVTAKSGVAYAMRIIDEARTPERADDDETAQWHELLDAVATRLSTDTGAQR